MQPRSARCTSIVGPPSAPCFQVTPRQPAPRPPAVQHKVQAVHAGEEVVNVEVAKGPGQGEADSPGVGEARGWLHELRRLLSSAAKTARQQSHLARGPAPHICIPVSRCQVRPPVGAGHRRKHQIIQPALRRCLCDADGAAIAGRDGERRAGSSRQQYSEEPAPAGLALRGQRWASWVGKMKRLKKSMPKVTCSSTAARHGGPPSTSAASCNVCCRAAHLRSLPDAKR